MENLDEHSVKFEVENALNSDLTNQSNPFLDDVRKNTFGSGERNVSSVKYEFSAPSF